MLNSAIQQLPTAGCRDSQSVIDPGGQLQERLGSNTGWGKNKDTQVWSPVENLVSIIYTFSAAAAHTFTWPCTLQWSTGTQCCSSGLLCLCFVQVLATTLTHKARQNAASLEEHCSKVMPGGYTSPCRHTLQQGTEMLQHIWQESSCSRKTLTFVILHSWFIHDNGLFQLQPSLFISGTVGEARLHAPGNSRLGKMPSFLTYMPAGTTTINRRTFLSRI